MNNEHQYDARASQAYAFDVAPQPFIKWLQRRLKANKRDAIDNLAKRIIPDVRLPRSGSISIFRSHLHHRGYSISDLDTFERAWSEMRTQQLESE